MEQLDQKEKISWYLIDEQMTRKTPDNYITNKIYQVSDVSVTFVRLSIVMIALHYIDTKNK